MKEQHYNLEAWTVESAAETDIAHFKESIWERIGKKAY